MYDFKRQALKGYKTKYFRMKLPLRALLFIAYLTTGCRSNETPKPRGFYRIDFPEKKYQLFDSICPFSFEYPIYGKIVKDMDRNAEPCFFNIEFARYQGKIHLSYKDVSKNV